MEELNISNKLKEAGWIYTFNEEDMTSSWKNPATKQELFMDWNTNEYKFSEPGNPGVFIQDNTFDSVAAEKYIYDNFYEDSLKEIEKLSNEVDINSFIEKIAEMQNTIDELTQKLSEKEASETEELDSEIEPEKNEVQEISDIPVLSYVTNEPFTGNNVNIAQTFRKYLIDNNKASADEQIILISQAQAESYGGKIKDNAEACVITCPPDEQHDDFWQEQYYYINDVEGLNQDNTIQESNQKETTKDSIKSEVGMKLPEQIAIITQKGLIAIDNTEVLAVSEDGTQITIGNSEQSVVVEPDTFDELMKPSEKINENKEAYNKLPETMYNDFFNPRDPNCADYFRHNFSVFCREKANSPIDALDIAKQIIQIMPKEEQKRTKKLFETCCKPGQSINELLIEYYEDAVKEVPLCEEWIKNNASEKYIPRQLTDIITANHEKIDRDSNLRIGDTLKNVMLNNEKIFGKGKEKINVGELKIISASKENNSITLMGSDKSYYELPRDKVLAAYQQQTLKQKHSNNKSYNMEFDI